MKGHHLIIKIDVHR